MQGGERLSSQSITGIQAFLNVLAAADVECIFGNPGTTELPLNDALASDRRFDYRLGIHEIPVVSMADGYAMATGRVAVANVHIACGLGNAMGMLYNAHIEGTPLLLTAGQQDRRLALGEPVLWGELTQVASPWTKWSYEVTRPEDVAQATRRAIQIAQTPPTGPVFLSFPVDVQTALFEPDNVPWNPADLATRVRPDISAIAKIARHLRDSRNPLILAGSRVAEAGVDTKNTSADAPNASSHLESIAEMLGAPVITEATSSHGRLPIDSAHASYRGRLPLWSNEIRELLAPHDVILAVGLDLFRTYIHDDPVDQPFDATKTWLQLDCNAHQLGKNFPVQLGVLGDLEYSLADLSAALQQDVAARPAVQHTSNAQGPDSIKDSIDPDKQVQNQWNDSPLSAEVLMTAVARALPTDAAVVEEAVTTHRNRLELMGVLRNPRRLFAHRGWALGWGIGCALGVQMAWPETPVLALLGDGAALYGIQGLWTAARYRIPVVFVICNNRQYKILKDCSQRMPLPNFAAENYLGMDITQPEVDFVQLSESLGVPAKRVETADVLVDELTRAFARREPFLIDVALGE